MRNPCVSSSLAVEFVIEVKIQYARCAKLNIGTVVGLIMIRINKDKGRKVVPPHVIPVESVS